MNDTLLIYLVIFLLGHCVMVLFHCMVRLGMALDLNIQQQPLQYHVFAKRF